MQQSDVAARDRARSHTGNRASRRRHSRLTRVALAATASALASASFAGPALANAQVPKVTSYDYSTVVNQQDPTFNQLLGINNFGQIAGYFGSGAQGHPNQGYLTSMPGAANNRFLGEDAPGSVQTQVTGLNDLGVTVGFWSDQNNASQINPNYGFYSIDGRILTVDFPTMDNANPPVNQLLGVNDTGTAVGFYNDSAGNAHGYAYNIRSGRFKAITVKGATSVTATGVSNAGTTTGFFISAGGAVDAFLQMHGGRTLTIAVPGASMTQAFGVNDKDEVVGAYTVGTGNNAVTHGFTWQGGKVTTVNYAKSSGTTVNGVNDEGDIVGFYTDAKGNTDGFVGLP